jgi:dATP pyrophosphohydrolase
MQTSPFDSTYIHKITFLMVNYKIPISVLVVIHTPALEVLLIERADEQGRGTGYWQSVTGSLDFPQETLRAAAVREVFEETGIDAMRADCHLTNWQLENVYDIYPQWQYRYAPGVVRNTEHVFGLCVPADTLVRLTPREHVAQQWLPYLTAADQCTSGSNAEAVLMLPRYTVQANFMATSQLQN